MDNFLEEGDIIKIEEGHCIYAHVPEHFVYSNKKGSFTLTREGVKVKGELSYLAGEYIVYKTTMDGGGTGHGPHDVYPDGHHVFAERKDGRRVDFYQSGSFTAMIKDIVPIGKAEKKWTKTD